MTSANERVWATNADYKQYFEEWMERRNAAQWSAMIERMREQDLTDRVVLDFGCNRGVSLHVLYSQRPFAHGYGIDLDTEAIQIACEHQGNLPVTYEARDNIHHLAGAIDIAFSHEVLYLLKDLDQHAREIYAALKPDGVYYAALGTHADNPVWQKYKESFARDAGVEPQDYTLFQITGVFERNGFAVQARKFKFDDFLDMALSDEEERATTSMIETLNYYSEYKILFRFTKTV